MRQQANDNREKINYFKSQQASNFLQLKDYTKDTTETIETFDKSTLREYLSNISSYQTELIQLSWFLYYRSMAYKRWVHYNAGIFDLSLRSVIPNYDISAKKNNDNKMLKSLNSICTQLDIMKIPKEFEHILTTCFIQDVFYGCKYQDDTGMFILPLPYDYCRIAGQYRTKDFAFAMDMSYFRGSTKQKILEYWGEPFTSMYKAYNGDNANKWQLMPDEYAACFKFNTEDYNTITPPALPAFESIISLCDLETISAIADKQSIFKMIWLEMETLSNSKQMEDWKIDPDTYIKYWNIMINKSLPDYVSAAIVPGKLNSISFSDTDKVNDTNKIANATKALFNSIGGNYVLNNTDVSSEAAVRAILKAEENFAIDTLLPQIEGWTNRMLTYSVGENTGNVIYYRVGTLTKSYFQDDILKQAEYGVPNKLLLGALNGWSEKQTLTLMHLENDILDLPNNYIPLASSHTQSGDLKNPVESGSSTSEKTE